jgi:hypothetical protein
VKDGERWGRGWGQLALAAADRIELALGEHMDTLYRLMQPHAEAFQRACGIDEASRHVACVHASLLKTGCSLVADFGSIAH